MTSKQPKEFDLDKWLDKLIKQLEACEVQEPKQKNGKLQISNSLVYRLTHCDGDVNRIMEIFYDELRPERDYMLSKYKGLLDEHDVEKIIFDSILEVGLIDNNEEIINFKALARKCVHDRCVDMIRRKKAKKRGGDTKFYYLDDTRDDRKQVQLDVKEKAYDTIDFIEWLEQIKPTLSENEYNYLKLIITETHSDEMTNTEIAAELHISEGTVRNIRKNLQTNKHLIDLLK